MAALICPRCDKELGPEHDKKACAAVSNKRVSRRFFFQVAFGGLMAAVTPAPKPPAFDMIKALEEFNAFTMENIAPKTADLYFTKSPLFYKLVGDKSGKRYVAGGPDDGELIYDGFD